jgi:ethylmalonyl-CoA mutase
VGFNKYRESEPSPLTADGASILVVSDHTEAGVVADLNAWRAARDDNAVQAALKALKAAAREDRNIMPPSIEAAKAGVTTGEWGAALREVFGEYRAPTGVSATARQVGGDFDKVRDEVARVSHKLGRRLSLLVGKPGLDGHSNGAEQIAVRARDVGMDVVYDGIRSTPAELVAAARDKRVHCIGLSILSGSHKQLALDLLAQLRAAGLGHIPVVVGGIIPPNDAAELRAAGIAAIYTPKAFDLNVIMTDLAKIAERAHTG